MVVNLEGYAIYFSREPIPSKSKWNSDVPMFKQVCIIPFRRDYLLQYNETPQTPMEKIESIDMLRTIETGGKILMVPMSHETLSIDTPYDLERVKEAMKSDNLREKYEN